MNDHTRAATLEEWMEAALTMAEVNGMSDDTVIPTWPADVVERSPGNHPELTVGALRQWQSDHRQAELSQAHQDYADDCNIGLLDMAIRDIEHGFTVCPECSAEIEHQKHPFDCLPWLKELRQDLLSGERQRRKDQAQQLHTPEMAGGGQRGACSECGLPPTAEGYDGCMGELPRSVVMNACCGHGNNDQAHVQFWDGTDIRGPRAIEYIEANRSYRPSPEPAQHQEADEVSFGDTGAEIEARLQSDIENACPSCGGSGHKDDCMESQGGEAVAFGNGEWTVEIGDHGEKPAVFVCPAYPPGSPGELAEPTTGGDCYRLLPGEWVMTFPTYRQAFCVADALTGRRVRWLDGTRPDDADPQHAAPESWVNAMERAMDICDCTPTLAQETAEYPYSRIGELVNSALEGGKGYSMIRDALEEMKAAPQPQPAVPDTPSEEMLSEGVTALALGLKRFPDNYTQIVNNIWEDMLSAAPQPKPNWNPGQQEGLLKLAEFGRQCFKALSEGGSLDPWDLQETASEAGLIEPHQRDEPCADGDPAQCPCLEYEADFPTTCYRVPDKYMPLLRDQLTRTEPPEVQ